ncbi:MAG: tRNA lysidine(34) synthetase TilS [Erythrobacter sp.]|jgi:tRNA(Ile)-lysidine synthase|nr:tRNA lysidine(34) synthetase TilS [Erythrobacter sp.]
MTAPSPAPPLEVDPALVQRFSAELERLWPLEDREDEAGEALSLGLAVSGGPDSLALLLLAAHALPGEVAVASVDHGLRLEAAGELALVERVCAALDVPFTPLKVRLAPGNLQARAREARYEALGRWVSQQGLGALASAHHADDQAETLLMRLARGSGLSGLAGVREASLFEPTGSEAEAFPLIRPLLGWRKAELERIVREAGLTPARDPSNTQQRFDRVRVREHLAAHDWLDPQALATSAQHLAEAWRAIEWYAQGDFEEMVMRDEEIGGFTYHANVPRIVQIETLRRIIAEMGGHVTRAEAGRAADRLWRGENASLGGVLCTPEVELVEKVGIEMRVWRFTPEPPRQLH